MPRVGIEAEESGVPPYQPLPLVRRGDPGFQPALRRDLGDVHESCRRHEINSLE